MTHASLFSGIGGFDLAAEWMGWDNLFHCEWNPFGQKVLKHHFPKSISYNDITKTDFTIHSGSVDILTGGFPCQPYSTAGKRLGKQDERHLFPEMLRCIKEVKPRWVVGENVRGLVSWNEGLVFHEVYDDLEREGYEVQSFLIPAASVGAPHQRYRVWFVAFNSKSQRNTTFGKFCKGENSKPFGICRNNEQKNTFNANDEGRSSRFGEIQSKNGEISQWNNNAEFSNTNSGNVTDSNGIGRGKNVGITNRESDVINKISEARDATNSNSWGLERTKEEGWNSEYAKWENENIARKAFTNSESIGQEYALENGELEGGRFRQSSKRNFWDSFPSKSPLCGGDDGIPRQLDSITFPKWRNESIKAYGNAIVPQVAHQIFKTIEEFEKLV
jgi:DNA (cytosine-5)-methyltransferase 1